MFPHLHKTPIGLLREYVESWALASQWTNETVADEIVKHHDGARWALCSKVHFDESTSNDRRRAANCARIFRWLNDTEKDTNLLSANFLPFVVAALPVEMQIGFWNDYLRDAGLCVSGLDKGEDGVLTMQHLTASIKEDSEAHQALADAIQNPTPEALARVERENSEAIEVKRRQNMIIRGMRAARASCGAMVNRVLRGKAAA